MNRLKSLAAVVAAVFAVSGPVSGQIKAGRAIMITIQGVPTEERGKIDNTYAVSDAGYINMPFIGDVRAAGLATDQLQVVLQNAYKAKQIYSNPTFQVLASNVDKLDQKMVHIGGQVRTAGPVEYFDGLTIYQAVQSAHGATEFGALNRVLLLRNGKQRELNLKLPQFMEFKVEPGDTITVPQKNWRGQ